MSTGLRKCQFHVVIQRHSNADYEQHRNFYLTCYRMCRLFKSVLSIDGNPGADHSKLSAAPTVLASAIRWSRHNYTGWEKFGHGGGSRTVQGVSSENRKAPVRWGFLLLAQALQSCFVCSASARRPLDLHHATPALALFRTRGSRWCVACMGWPNPSNAT